MIHARVLFDIIDSPIYTYGVDFRLLFLELGNAKALKRRQQENVYAFFYVLINETEDKNHDKCT